MQAMKMRVAPFAKQHMTRKDSEKEADRPHYYSQFWLDIAAGRRTIGGPKPEDEGELLDDVQEPVAIRRATRNESEDDLDGDNGHVEVRATTRGRATAVATPVEEVPAPELVQIPEPEQTPEPAPVAEDVAEPVAQVETVEDADIPDVDLAEEEEEEEDEDDTEEDEDEDEDEEDNGGWAGRGRKKPAPKRAVKQPPVKRPKREPRRGF